MSQIAAASKINKLFPSLLKAAKRHPVQTGIGVGLTLPPLLEMGMGGVRGVGRQFNVGGSADRQFQDQRRANFEMQRLQQKALERQAELTRLVEANTMELARKAPHVFNQVMAGRKLPRGAMVFGGVPRTDLLQEVATEMAMGAYGQPDPSTMGGGLGF